MVSWKLQRADSISEPTVEASRKWDTHATAKAGSRFDSSAASRRWLACVVAQACNKTRFSTCDLLQHVLEKTGLLVTIIARRLILVCTWHDHI